MPRQAVATAINKTDLLGNAPVVPADWVLTRYKVDHFTLAPVVRRDLATVKGVKVRFRERTGHALPLIDALHLFIANGSDHAGEESGCLSPPRTCL
jgi:hypothetical protein